jgi:hypothetical protein
MRTIRASMLLLAACMLLVEEGPDSESQRTRILALENAWNKRKSTKTPRRSRDYSRPR